MALARPRRLAVAAIAGGERDAVHGDGADVARHRRTLAVALPAAWAQFNLVVTATDAVTRNGRRADPALQSAVAVGLTTPDLALQLFQRDQQVEPDRPRLCCGPAVPRSSSRRPAGSAHWCVVHRLDSVECEFRVAGASTSLLYSPTVRSSAT